MRKAYDKIKSLYGTDVGGDIMETLAMAGALAGGQALFTDASPEEIAIAAAVGIPAGFAGRQLGSKLGQRIGKSIEDSDGSMSNKIINRLRNMPGEGGALMNQRLSPVVNAGANEQLGYLIGKLYGDNILQTATAAAVPLFVGNQADA